MTLTSAPLVASLQDLVRLAIKYRTVVTATIEGGIGATWVVCTDTHRLTYTTTGGDVVWDTDDLMLTDMQPI